MSSPTPKPICERIGAKVRERRKAMGLSLVALVDRTDLSKTYLWEIEHGQCEPGAGTVVRLARALGMTTDELLGVEESRVRDWRIGLSCKPVLRTHELYYERGEIVDVKPNGTGGHCCKDGVLVIRMQSGRVFMAPASDWQTA